MRIYPVEKCPNCPDHLECTAWADCDPWDNEIPIDCPLEEYFTEAERKILWDWLEQYSDIYTYRTLYNLWPHIGTPDEVKAIWKKIKNVILGKPKGLFEFEEPKP